MTKEDLVAKIKLLAKKYRAEIKQYVADDFDEGYRAHTRSALSDLEKILAECEES